MMKCNYCGRNETCEGKYPEGCFMENEIDYQSNDYKSENIIDNHILTNSNVPDIKEIIIRQSISQLINEIPLDDVISLFNVSFEGFDGFEYNNNYQPSTIIKSSISVGIGSSGFYGDKESEK